MLYVSLQLNNSYTDTISKLHSYHTRHFLPLKIRQPVNMGLKIVIDA